MNHKISKIVIATHNTGKIKEFQYLLKPYEIKCFPISNFSNLIPKETGKSFKQNAIIKAINASKISGLPSLADDSGLVIPLLKNKPGIYSARWAKNAGNYYSAMYLIKAKLENMQLPNKKVPAYFICNLTYATTEGILMNYEGNSGFGYDPIFIPDGELKTLAQMSNEKKQSLSHRREAFEKFKLDKLI